MGFGLMTLYIVHFDVVHDYSLYFTLTPTLMFTVTYSLAIAWYQPPMADSPLPLGLRMIPGSSHQLVIASSYND
jgi:hypothetical protein